MDYTHRELNCLLKMRRKPRTWAYLLKVAKTTEKDLDVMLSRMENLWYVKDDKPTKTGLITLNQIGETVAQAEFDRRFDMYFTRAVSFLALVVSIVSLVITAAMQEAQCLNCLTYR